MSFRGLLLIAFGKKYPIFIDFVGKRVRFFFNSCLFFNISRMFVNFIQLVVYNRKK